MKLQDVAELLVKAKRYVPEAARVKLCYMFASLFNTYIQRMGPEQIENWKTRGVGDFLHNCQVDSLPAAVVADMRVRESLLSEFCNKWTNVTQFRQSGGGEWIPITADMNSLRLTMVKELISLSKTT